MTPTPAVPDLRIVSVQAVLPHEEHDAQRSEPLMRRIASANTWLNPPIVAPFDSKELGSQYVILDGANRYHSVKALGIPHILVQVVDYDGPDVELETWNHVLSDYEIAPWLAKLVAIEGLHLSETVYGAAEEALETGSAIAYIRVLPEQVFLLSMDESGTHAQTQMLSKLVNTYKTIAKIDRHTGENSETVSLLYPRARAMIVFPRYSPDEIIAAARDNVLLPPGISRHIIQGRAMRLHYPLEALRDASVSLEEKNAALRKWIQERVAKRAMRLYIEATYIFDD
jgi:hypothetical protein